MVKVQAINIIDIAIGRASGYLHDAEMFGPDFICEAPRLTHDSSV
jgi:hypothetical protein